MNRIVTSKKIIYLFYIAIVLFFTYAFFVFIQFKDTKKSIEEAYFQANIEYVRTIAENISKNLQKITTDGSLKATLQKSSALREELERSLELFRTKRYRYIYVVTKESNSERFRFLLDGAKENKSEFLEEFMPLKTEKWVGVYKSKEATFFQNRDAKGLWITYLYPIIIHNHVEAILAIDFSLAEERNIQDILDIFIQSSKTFIVLSLFVLLIVMLLLSYEKKRTRIIKEQSREIQEFNNTLQKRIEEEVAKNREKDKQMLQQSRLAQMGEMIGMIAHQWRQPLSAISSASIAINMKAQMDMLDSKSAIELAEKISEFTQYLSKTIDDFREFYKDKKEKQDVTYKELIDSTLNIVEVSLKNKNIKLVIEMQSEITFHTYANELKQVLLNLIKNAEDALLEKGVESPCIKIITQENRLIVSDNGGGIPEDIIDKIFDPYFSTKKNLNGTGLGLYMSKTIIEEHCEGKLSVHNGEDGAVFVVELSN
ncbi:PUTATIVE TWO-COMPONENT SENSOR [hydrothermal vent metagenome]|uniref:PUTATIVE TWO-COMPONENT SENSOR n=1 Tax=hydrothermal vent metagenome TaxID=652676 RepID=A0A1W1C858_9ZZZZ